MSIPKFRGCLYLLARLLGDAQLVRRGPHGIGRRVARRAAGRGMGRLLRRLVK